MTLTQIHALLTVLECGGFTEASKRLYMTQSAVSRHFGALKKSWESNVLSASAVKTFSSPRLEGGSFRTCA